MLQMITDEFDFGTANRCNFCVALRSDGAPTHFIPTDDQVKGKLGEMLQHTLAAINALPEPWQEFDISEDYGARRRIYAPLERDYMLQTKALYDGSHDQELPDFHGLMKDVDYYFSVFWDQGDRKIIGVKRAAQLKATLGAQGKLIRWLDDTLTVVDEPILRLDREFDALITATNAYILDPRHFEYVADIVNLVAGAAKQKVDDVSVRIPFIDFSRIATDISKHPRCARVVASIAARADLHLLDRDKLCALAERTKVKLKDVDGKLQPTRACEYGLLQLLDNRRYDVDLTTDSPLAFQATGRRAV